MWWPQPESHVQYHVIVWFLLPLSTLVDEHCVQRQQDDPVAGIDNCPHDKNDLFCFRKGFSSLLDYCVDNPKEEDGEPNRDGNQTDEVHHYCFSPRCSPSGLVDGCYCKHFSRQQAWHVQYWVKRHEYHDYVTSEAAGEWWLDQCDCLHNK